MGLRIIKQSLESLSNDNFLRTDFSYIDIVENNFNTKTEKRLADYLTFLETGKSIKKTDYAEEESEYVHVVVKNIRHNQVDLSEPLYIKEEKGESFQNFRLIKNDIVIAISSNVGASFLYEGESDLNLTLSHYLARARVNEEKLLPKYLSYYLNSNFMKKYFRATETGKTQKNLSKWYIKNLPIFFTEEVDIQKEVVNKIEPIEQDIKNLIEIQRIESDIINEVFMEELKLNQEEFNKVKNIKVFKTAFSEFTENIDLRYSEKFHHPAHKYMLDFLATKTTKRIKDFVSEPIVLGKTISPKQYEEESDCYYMSMATIKSWYFDSSEAKCVSEEYENNNLDKKVALNDIIIARSGEGTIGKVALINSEDTNAVFADFTMRVRLENYNHEFAYYYFRSLFFQHLVKHNKKGLGNNTNIFPSQIGEFPILDYSLVEQAKLVKKIKTRILDQQKYTKEIEAKRAEIENLILDSLN